MIPDKVYVKKEKNNVVYSLSVQYNNGGEVYIRKDALIEWLEGRINFSDGGFVNGLLCLAYKDVIKHLNEM